jgi:hypothetical protein
MCSHSQPSGADSWEKQRAVSWGSQDIERPAFESRWPLGMMFEPWSAFAPSPPSTSYGLPSSPWISETPKNAAQISKQMQLVQTAYERQSQSPTESMSKVAKSASTAWGIIALQTQRIAELEASNKLLQEKKKRTKKQLQHGGILQVAGRPTANPRTG